MSPFKVYDCITFFNELDILEIRMNELDPVVDHFVIVEATTTHTGMPKILYFEENKERFAKFANKIIHTIVQLPKEGDTWIRERAQRDCIGDVLKAKCIPGDTVIISDADEIPRMEVVRDYRNVHGPKQFEQQLHYYALNSKCTNDPPWHLSKILPYDLYTSSNMTPCMVRYSQFAALKDAGWHFSFIGNVEFIRKKISSWAHSEFNTPEINNDTNISASITNGKDLFGRHHVFELVTIDSTYPKFIQDNIVAFIKKGLLRG